MVNFKNMKVTEKSDFIKRILNVVFGTLILVLGQAIFIEQCHLAIGGIVSIGNIINVFFPSQDTVRIVAVTMQVICFMLGLIFLGKKFAAQTLLSTIVYIVAYPIVSSFLQNPTFSFLWLSNPNDNLTRLLAGLVGSMVSGIGISMCLVGGGSSGGVDIFAIIFAKITKTKTSLWIFIVDALVVLLGFILIDSDFVYFIICVLSALSTSVTIEVMISKRNNSFVVNIVSKEWQQINNFILNNLERGTTLIDALGGYTKENRRAIQTVISREQYSILITKISEIDKGAFVYVYNAHEVKGEGFKSLVQSKKGDESHE